MNTNYRYLLLVTTLIIASLACVIGGTAPTSTPVPTNTPAPTKTPAPTESPTAPDQPTTGFELDSSKYSHKQKFFEFYSPKGWAKNEGDFDVWFSSPEDDASGVYAAITNTGYELDAESFNNFVVNMEASYYTYNEDFKEIEREENADEIFVKIEKSYTDSNQVKRRAVSIYDQEGASVFVLELIASDELYEGYFDSFDKLISDVTVNSGNAASLPIYQLIWTFRGPEDAFTIEVPSAFSYSYDDTTYNNAIIESLYSPDGLALIESISVIDGNTYTIGNAGIATQQLLNERYTSGGGDVKVSKVETLKDGSELWTWTSRKGGYSGFTNLEIRNKKQILILSFVANNDTYEMYEPVFDSVLASYTIP